MSSEQEKDHNDWWCSKHHCTKPCVSCRLEWEEKNPEYELSEPDWTTPGYNG